jgi:AraC family transcriptional regulator
MQIDLEFSAPTINIDVAAYPPGATFGPREMKEWEFVWLMEGDAEYRYNDQAHQAPEGSIVLCRPGGRDYFRWDTRRQTRHAYFHFMITHIPSDWPAVDEWPFVRQPPDADILRPMFQHLLTWRDKGHETTRKLGIAHLLASFVFGEMETSAFPRQQRWPDAVERVWKYVQERLQTSPEEPISLEELAEVGCVTEEHLCRVFKEATGVTPVHAVRMARLDRALTLLVRSNYSVKEIARLLGFASVFHFSRVFKEAYGRSPRDLRKEIEKGAPVPLNRLVKRLWA